MAPAARKQDIMGEMIWIGVHSLVAEILKREGCKFYN